MSIWSKLARVFSLLDAGGVPLLAKETAAFLGGAPATLPPPPPRDRRLLDHRYIAACGAGGSNPWPAFDRTPNPQRLVINWLIPPFDIGSGGHMTIFRMIRNLEALGHDNQIYLLFGHPEVHDAAAIKTTIDQHFVPLQAEVSLDMGAMRDSDVVFATSWPTAYPVCQVPNTLRKAYFVQDFEPDFYPKGSEWYFAEATYRFGFYHLTAGPWLAAKLRSEYGAEAEPFALSWERGFYAPPTAPKPPGSPFRVLFYARPVTPRRCFELGMLALNLFYKRHPQGVEIITLGGDLSGYESLFPVTDLGVVPLVDLPGIYRSCDLALVHSATNCSLLPLELMASGVPVIDLDVPNVAGTLTADVNARLATPTPWAIAEELERLYTDQIAREALAAKGLAHALQQPTWEDAARVVEKGLRDQLASRQPIPKC